MVHCNLFSPSAKLLIRAHLPTEFLQSGLVAVRDKAVTIKTDPDIMTTGTIGRARKAPDDTFNVTIIKPRPRENTECLTWEVRLRRCSHSVKAET